MFFWRRDKSMTATSERPFAATIEKYNAEHASGKVTGTNFPYHEIQSLPGYSERQRPGLTASDVARELANHLADYSESHGCPLQYQQREVAHYLWLQASRGVLPWDEVLSIVRANRKRDGHPQIAHYFGYCEVVGPDGSAKYKKLIKLIRYIMQEGVCAGCQVEFQFSDLTVDRIKPGALGGEYVISNVQLMCQPCNDEKGAKYSG